MSRKTECNTVYQLHLTQPATRTADFLDIHCIAAHVQRISYLSSWALSELRQPRELKTPLSSSLYTFPLMIPFLIPLWEVITAPKITMTLYGGFEVEVEVEGRWAGWWNPICGDERHTAGKHQRDRTDRIVMSVTSRGVFFFFYHYLNLRLWMTLMMWKVFSWASSAGVHQSNNMWVIPNFPNSFVPSSEKVGSVVQVYLLAFSRIK